MARAILLAAAIALTTAGLVALAIAILAADRLAALIPPLVIDIDALRGAVIAIGGGFIVLGVVHGLVLVGLRQGRRVAWTVGVLLGAGMSALCVALTAAAATTAVTDPGRALAFLGGALAAGIGAVAYGMTAWQLIRERQGSAD